MAFGAKCYWELHKWARQCQNARIAIAYKRRVQLQAPITEFLAWISMLDDDKDAHGRVIYRNGGVSVAITKAVKSRKKPVTKPEPPREGKWAINHDEPVEA